jgi:pheromone shutdown-related protein TraB
MIDYLHHHVKEGIMNSTIEAIQINNKTIVLVKTAHVSKQSVEDVKTAIEMYQPNTVCVELDRKRAESILNPQQWEKTNIISIIKNKQTFYLIANMLLGNYQKKIAKDLDIPLGAEMIQAINTANEYNIPIRYIDRSVQITFTRIWRLLKFKEKFNLLLELVASMFTKEEITAQQLEELKQSDMIQQALLQIQGKYSTIKTILIDERDRYMATKIKRANQPVVVAVIGAAHAEGIKKALFEQHSIRELEEIPKKKPLSKWVGWVIPLMIIGIIVLTFTIDPDVGWQQIKTWVLLNGTLSAIGTALVLAHPLTILTAFVVAPISSLNPLLAAGWFAGLTEAMINKPTVKDLQNISDDFTSIKRMLNNRFIKILLIVIFANVFSTIATFLSSFQIIRSFIDSL